MRDNCYWALLCQTLREVVLPSPSRWILTKQCVSESLRLVKTEVSGPHPQSSDSVGVVGSLVPSVRVLCSPLPYSVNWSYCLASKQNMVKEMGCHFSNEVINNIVASIILLHHLSWGKKLPLCDTALWREPLGKDVWISPTQRLKE